METPLQEIKDKIDIIRDRLTPLRVPKVLATLIPRYARKKAARQDQTPGVLFLDRRRRKSTQTTPLKVIPDKGYFSHPVAKAVEKKLEMRVTLLCR